jgi:hypothetical protein
VANSGTAGVVDIAICHQYVNDGGGKFADGVNDTIGK